MLKKFARHVITWEEYFWDASDSRTSDFAWKTMREVHQGPKKGCTRCLFVLHKIDNSAKSQRLVRVRNSYTGLYVAVAAITLLTVACFILKKWSPA